MKAVKAERQSASAGSVDMSLREQERPPGRLPGELETMETRVATIAHKHTQTRTHRAVNTARGKEQGEQGEGGGEEQQCNRRKGSCVLWDGHMWRFQERLNPIFIKIRLVWWVCEKKMKDNFLSGHNMTSRHKLCRAQLNRGGHAKSQQLGFRKTLSTQYGTSLTGFFFACFFSFLHIHFKIRT